MGKFLLEWLNQVGGGAIGTQTAGIGFNIQIIAQDANNNTVTLFEGAGNTVDISSTGTLSAGSGATATFTNGVLAAHSVTITNADDAKTFRDTNRRMVEEGKQLKEKFMMREAIRRTD